jgi:stress response protein YsnF
VRENEVARRPRHDPETIPVVEERAVVHRRRKITGAVRLRTVVHEDEAVIDEPLLTEEVEVERVSLDRWVDGPVPVRYEGDTTVITVLREVLVVERRLKAVEEVRLTKQRAATRHASERVRLRREEALVERLDAAATRSGDDEDD